MKAFLFLFLMFNREIFDSLKPMIMGELRELGFVAWGSLWEKFTNYQLPFVNSPFTISA